LDRGLYNLYTNLCTYVVLKIKNKPVSNVLIEQSKLRRMYLHALLILAQSANCHGTFMLSDWHKTESWEVLRCQVAQTIKAVLTSEV